jgi:hypothetical protein
VIDEVGTPGLGCAGFISVLGYKDDGRCEDRGCCADVEGVV